MKKEVTVIQDFCDVCGKTSNDYSCCHSCGKNFCYDCKKVGVKEYNHGVHFSGSGDGLYCLECDAKLIKSGDKKHAAYRLIEALRNESSGYYADFKLRCDKAEANLKQLLKG